MIIEKTPYPDWANPYQATWTGSEWVVRFPTASDAIEGALEITRNLDPEWSAVANPDPNSNDWYVYVVTP